MKDRGKEAVKMEGKGERYCICIKEERANKVDDE
jgi:hypothetical protein